VLVEGGGGAVFVALVSVSGAGPSAGCSAGCCGAGAVFCAGGGCGAGRADEVIGGGTYACLCGACEAERGGGLYDGLPPLYTGWLGGGTAPARALDGCGDIGTAFGFSANALVVSAFVLVIGGSVSPGPAMLDVTPAADPS
jgi:hypothetical protein